MHNNFLYDSKTNSGYLTYLFLLWCWRGCVHPLLFFDVEVNRLCFEYWYKFDEFFPLCVIFHKVFLSPLKKVFYCFSFFEFKKKEKLFFLKKSMKKNSTKKHLELRKKFVSSLYLICCNAREKTFLFSIYAQSSFSHLKISHRNMSKIYRKEVC